jgi:hypothetical protein
MKRAELLCSIAERPAIGSGDGKLELVLLRSFANYTGYQQRRRRKNLRGYAPSTQTELARERGYSQV